jgi:hypothetical protein
MARPEPSAPFPAAPGRPQVPTARGASRQRPPAVAGVAMGEAVARVGPVVPVGSAVRVATGDGAARPIGVAPAGRPMRVDSVAPVVPVARTVLETPAVRDVAGDTSAA